MEPTGSLPPGGPPAGTHPRVEEAGAGARDARALWCSASWKHPGVWVCGSWHRPAGCTPRTYGSSQAPDQGFVSRLSIHFSSHQPGKGGVSHGAATAEGLEGNTGSNWSAAVGVGQGHHWQAGPCWEAQRSWGQTWHQDSMVHSTPEGLVLGPLPHPHLRKMRPGKDACDPSCPGPQPRPQGLPGAQQLPPCGHQWKPSCPLSGLRSPPVTASFTLLTSTTHGPSVSPSSLIDRGPPGSLKYQCY